MAIEIKARFGGRVLYTAETAADVRAAVVEAASRGADLRGADLRGADLGGADLRGAYLRGADHYTHPLWPIRADLRAILDAAPAEVLAVIAALKNGSVYKGECACLVGTIAQARGVEEDDLPGITPDGSRPAEQWFYPIKKGDAALDAMPELPPYDPANPLPLPDDYPTEGVYRATLALEWCREWVAERVAGISAYQALATNQESEQ